MKYTISALVENKTGVLARISGLFARRGFNIDSLAVGVTDNENISRITIVVSGDEYTADQVTKQLTKLVDVVTVKILNERNIIRRDLILVKIAVKTKQRSEIIDIARIMGGDIVDISHTTLTIEFDDRAEKVDLLIDLLAPYKIVELVRTGSIALEKGAGTVYDEID